MDPENALGAPPTTIQLHDSVTARRLETVPLPLIDDPDIRILHETYSKARREGWGGKVVDIIPAGGWFEWEPAYIIRRGRGASSETAVHIADELELVSRTPQDFSPMYDLNTLYKWLS